MTDRLKLILKELGPQHIASLLRQAVAYGDKELAKELVEEIKRLK